jgi:phage terminase large subunit
MAKIQACKQYEEIGENYKNYRTLLFQGGTRSGKTYSIMMWLIVYALQNENVIVNVFRKTRSSIDSSILKDFKSIMNDLNIYDPAFYNKATMKYTFHNNSSITFMGCDDPEKIKGVKSDIAYLNEVSSFHREDYRQISLRVTVCTIMDYNPNMPTYHFVFKEVIPQVDSMLFKSTYKDNPFLNERQIKEIERYKYTDENYWRIYGLGEQGLSEETIFPNFELTSDYDKITSTEYFGMDFGYNHPTTLAGVKVVDKEHKELYIKQYLYKTGLTVTDMHHELLELNKLPDGVMVDGSARVDMSFNNLITADSESPENIEELVRHGWNMEGAKKGAGSRRAGILKIKEHRIFLDKQSADLIEEFSMYKWQKHRNGVDILEKPEDGKDHLIDAVRYALENIGNEVPYYFGIV